MRGTSQQVMLDSFFGSLGEDGDLQRGVSDRGFAKARDRLAWGCLERLSTFVVQLADDLGLVPRWQGLRVVAADASVLMPAVRPCLIRRSSARADQRLFSLYLPGAELTLHANVHGANVSERQMLFEALECLGPDDVLVLDRVYPVAWLVAYLTENKIRFCMRCDKVNGWTAMRSLIRSGQSEIIATLKKPSRLDAADYLCSGAAPQVRLGSATSPLTERSGCWLPICRPRISRPRCLGTCTISAGALRRPTSGSSIVASWKVCRGCPSMRC